MKFNKKIIIFTIIIFLFSTNLALGSDKDIRISSIENLTFKQEINIPFDVSLPEAEYQPIDIRINFDNPCWGKNETFHSIRVAYYDNTNFNEIESQVYDLEFKDKYISSCSVVFLVPPGLKGNEKFYIFYDSKETEPTNYEDHVKVEDTHYFYEPIPGQKIDVDYYGIWDDGYIIYGIVQTGALLGNPVSQGILKFIPGSKVVETYNMDQLGTFDMRYGTIEQPGYIGSSWATVVRKSILVDGNLMVRVRIEGISPRGDIKSDNIFTYYHSPIEKRRIFVNVNHEVLKDINIEEPTLMDGTYCGIVSIKSRSATIEKMNVGDILPKIYLYSEEEEIVQYNVPQNPSSSREEPVLSTEDDVDLGKNAWICLSNDKRSHGIVLDRNIGFLKSDDGLQVKAWVKENIKLPGLEADTGNLYVSRDSYERGGKHEKDLKQGYKVNFNAVFLTLENSYEGINEEAEIYKKQVKNIPIFRDNVTEVKETKKFSLTCYVHLAPSAPLGSLLSAAIGKKVPYIYAELYKDNSFRSSGSVSRLTLRSADIDLKNKSTLEKIKTILEIFDIRNSTIFKSIVFPELEEGRYVVKIFRENPFFGKERKFIGYSIVDLKENKTTHIYCKAETKSLFTILDQNKNGIKGAKIQILYDNLTIADGITDENGTLILKVPSQNKKYTLRVIYKGFLIEEKELKLGILNHFKTKIENFVNDLYTLKLKIKDNWDLAPAVDLNPKITSNEMFEQMYISGEKKGDIYYFENIPSRNYTIAMKYKSFELEKKINLDGNKNIEIKFPAEYKIDLNIRNSFGMDVKERGEIRLYREGKRASFNIENGRSAFSVPPGEYKVDIIIEDEISATQKILVNSEKTLDIVTNRDSLLHSSIIWLGLIIILLSIVISILKKKFYSGVKLIVITLIIISLATPWWVLSGEKDDISTNTKAFLIPPKIVTLTTSKDTMGGEISQLPEEVTKAFTLLSFLLILCCIFAFVTIFTKNKFNKLNKILSVLNLLILLISVIFFFYVMSQITMVSVGSFVGSGNIDITPPGYVESESVYCSWGPGLGFYIAIVSIVIFFVFSFLKNKLLNIK